jgi:quercetin dioxygenase-like cupin family protein
MIAKNSEVVAVDLGEGVKRKILASGDTYYVPPGVKHGVIALEEGVLLDVFTPQRKDFSDAS